MCFQRRRDTNCNCSVSGKNECIGISSLVFGFSKPSRGVNFQMARSVAQQIGHANRQYLSRPSLEQW